jgi:hypothetical protein
MRLTLVNTVSDSSAAATAAPLACVWLWPLQASRNEKRGRETRVGASQADRQTGASFFCNLGGRGGGGGGGGGGGEMYLISSVAKARSTTYLVRHALACGGRNWPSSPQM